MPPPGPSPSGYSDTPLLLNQVHIGGLRHPTSTRASLSIEQKPMSDYVARQWSKIFVRSDKTKALMTRKNSFSPVTGYANGNERYWDPTTTWKTAAGAELVRRAREALFKSRSARLQTVGMVARQTSKRFLAKEEATVGALVLDALAHHLSADQTTLLISLNNNWLGSGPEDVPARNRTVNNHLYDLEAAGWLRANRSTLVSNSFRTSFGAGEVLIEYARELGIRLQDIGAGTTSEVFVVNPMRADDGKALSTSRTDVCAEGQRVQQQMLALNRFIGDMDISTVSELPPLDTRRRHLQRVFLDASLKRGGRTGGSAFWLNLPKDRRRSSLLMNGERIAEVDIKAAVPSIAYALKGLKPKSDPYTVPALKGATRDAIKLAVMQFLWSPFSRRTGRLSEEARSGIPKHYSPWTVFEAIVQHNSDIAEFIGVEPPRGAELQWHESEVIVEAAISSFKAGVPCLPLHDALIVPRSGAKVATAVLHGVFYGRFGVAPELEVTHAVGGSDGWTPRMS